MRTSGFLTETNELLRQIQSGKNPLHCCIVIILSGEYDCTFEGVKGPHPLCGIIKIFMKQLPKIALDELADLNDVYDVCMMCHPIISLVITFMIFMG